MFSTLRNILLGVVTAVIIVLLPGAANAHSLGSSTIAVRVTDDSVDATISLAIETLDEALGTDHLDEVDLDVYSHDVIAYLDDHLTVTSVDGTEWGETYTNPVRESVEGIESFSVVVTFDTSGSDTSDFVIDYDAIIEAVAGHEAVVVLTDSNDDISTPGIIDSTNPTLEINDTSTDVAIADMVHFGFEHVLDGADHLLFLTTLLIPAPLMIMAGVWRRASGGWRTVLKVVHVVTAFTIGHSVTLIASGLGWVSLPARPVEILIAASVGVSALHTIHPLVDRGEEIIAVGFGLVHGLAFAGILADLGLEGTTSVVALLSFNIGIELAQLLMTAVVFPSLYVMSTTRFYPALRVAAGLAALAASITWAFDRLGAFDTPLAPIEDAAINHPWRIVAGLSIAAAVSVLVDRPLRRRNPPTAPHGHDDDSTQPGDLSGPRDRATSDRRAQLHAGR